MQSSIPAATIQGMDRFFPFERDAHIRASDADRDQVGERLRAACAEGRLSPDELSARLDRCLRAKTLGELRPLTADLPRPAAAMERRRRRCGRGLAHRSVPHPGVIVLALLGGYLAIKAGVWVATAVAFGVGAFAVAIVFAVLPIVLVAVATLWILRRVFGGPPAHRYF